MENAEKIKIKIADILKKYGVVRAAFFGSFARGESNSRSDIDILVEFPSTKSLLDLVELQIEVEDRLEMKVDLLTYNSLLPAIKDSVLKEQVPIL